MSRVQWLCLGRKRVLFFLPRTTVLPCGGEFNHEVPRRGTKPCGGGVNHEVTRISTKPFGGVYCREVCLGSRGFLAAGSVCFIFPRRAAKGREAHAERKLTRRAINGHEEPRSHSDEVKPQSATNEHEALRRCIFCVKHSLRCALPSRARARIHCNHVFCCHLSLPPLFSGTFQQVPDLFAHYRGTLVTLPRYSRYTTAVLSWHYRGTLTTLPRRMTGESKKCNYGVTRACAREMLLSPSHRVTFVRERDRWLGRFGKSCYICKCKNIR